MAATKPSKTPIWGRWLEIHRRECGLSQRKLAERSGGTVSPAQIQRWETGAEPTVIDVVNTCAALGIPVTQFLVAARYVDPDDLGAVIAERIDVTGLTSRELLDELARRLVEAERATVDDTSTDDPSPLRRRVVPVVRPEALGAEGRDWAALRQQD